MAPKKLSGFVNVYADGRCDGDVFNSKLHADELQCEERIACIDLSQLEEGRGL